MSPPGRGLTGVGDPPGLSRADARGEDEDHPGPGAAPRRRRGLIPTLVYCGLCTSVVGSLGALLIPTIADDQDIARGTAQWVLTAALLVGAVATPVLGALSDGPRRRRVLLATLALVLVGSVLAATATSFGQLLVGRALQGLAYGVIPMATAMARALLPPERVRGTAAALSVTTVTGAGLSFPVTGIVVEQWGYHAAFWLAVVFTAPAFLAVLATAPRDDPAAHPSGTRLDWTGAGLLAVALAGLLVAVSQGDHWGWASPVVIGLFTLAGLLFPVWAWVELRTPHPLVQLRSMVNRDVALANVTTLVLGAMLFAASSSVSQLLQTPSWTGYGFGLAVFATGLAMLPTSVASVAANGVMHVLGRWFTPHALLPLGPLFIGLDMAFLALFHDHLWQVFVGVFLHGLATGASLVLMPALILAAVPPQQTGSAIGLNQVLRTVGGSVGSALVGALLAAATLTGERLPLEHGYTLVFGTTAAACAVLTVALLAMSVSRRHADGSPGAAPSDAAMSLQA
jgi:predicted MFS family arabinose efflux permease